MLLLEQVIKSRLAGRSALAAWQVRGASQLCDRTQVPAVEVRMSGAGLGDVSREAEFVDAGLVGYAVEFTTVSVFESLDA